MSSKHDVNNYEQQKTKYRSASTKGTYKQSFNYNSNNAEEDRKFAGDSHKNHKFYCHSREVV
jgi:hypothetical protein